MLSDFQVKKLSKLFTVLDLSHDNLLNKPDFDIAATKFLKVNNIPEHFPKSDELHKMYLHLWEECIEKPCDISGDGNVTIVEWLGACKSVLETKVGHENIDFFGTTIYESLDINHDKRITYEEFKVFHEVYDIYDEVVTPQVYNILDANHNGTLSKDEIIEAVNQFFYSNNPNLPGNFLFGKI